MTASANLSIRAVQAGLLATAAALGLLAGVDPKASIAAAVGLAFTAIVFANLTVGICLFTVVSFLDLLPFGGAAATFAKVAGALLFGSWLLSLAARGERSDSFLEVHPWATYLMFSFIGWAGFSLLWAEDTGAGLDALQRFGLNIVLFLIVFTAIRERSHVIWITTAFLVGALASATYGILSPKTSTFDEVVRLGGAGVDPNELAATLVAALLIGAGVLAARGGRPIVRLLAATAIGFSALAVFLSLSRGGLVALGVALVAACFVGGRWRPAAALLLLCVLLGGLGYYSFLASPEAVERVTETGGGTGRSDIWAVGWRMVESSPTNGIGVGNFNVASIHFVLEPGALQRDEFLVNEPQVAHNTYLGVLAELGVVGLVMFLAIFAFAIASYWRAVKAFQGRGDVELELIARASLVGLIGLLAAIFFISEEFSKQLWLLLALGPGMLRVARRAPDEPAPA